jgi:hypothetical protein
VKKDQPTAKFGAEHSGNVRLTFDELPSLHFTKMARKKGLFALFEARKSAVLRHLIR